MESSSSEDEALPMAEGFFDIDRSPTPTPPQRGTLLFHLIMFGKTNWQNVGVKPPHQL